MNGIIQFWWRGALGGGLGSVLLTLVIVVNAIHENPYNVLLVAYLGGILLIVGFLGVLLGAAVGTLLCFLSVRLQRSFSFVSRLPIGTVFAQLLTSPFICAAALNPKTVPATNLTSVIVESFVVAISTGGLAALLLPSVAGPKPNLRQWPGGVVR